MHAQQRSTAATLVAIWERHTERNPVVRRYVAAALRNDEREMMRLIDDVHKQGEALGKQHNVHAYAASCAAACVVLVHRREYEVAKIALQRARTHDVIARGMH